MKLITTLIVLVTILTKTATAVEKNIYTPWIQKVAETEFSGLILVVKGDSILLEKTFGLANREREIPYRENTVFNIGSVTKQFTAAAILKLQESGKLVTDDLISQYIDDVPADKKNISIHHLLTHTAGLVATKGEGSANLYNIVTRKELIDFALSSDLISLPGEKYNYSNVGYNLLAIIIETVSGENYESYFRKHLLTPAGMENTGYRLVERNYSNVTENYGADASFLEKLFAIKPKSQSVGNPFEHLEKEDGPRFNMEGAGGLTSTIHDIMKWHIALNSEAILNKRSKAMLFGVHNPPIAPKSIYHYGYGWLISEDENGDIHAQHSGSNGYSLTELHRFLKEEIAIIISTNDRDHYPEELMKELIHITKVHL